MIRVAFDGQSQYGRKSGLGVYTTSLLSAINELSSSDVSLSIFPEEKSKYASSLNTTKRLSWEVMGAPHALKQKKFDLFHVPGFAYGWPQVKTVLTVHDLIGMTFPNQKGIASRFYWG